MPWLDDRPSGEGFEEFLWKSRVARSTVIKCFPGYMFRVCKRIHGIGVPNASFNLT